MQEDDLIMASEIKLFLTTQGYVVPVVYHALNFLNGISPENFDLFILDINVLQLNGIEIDNLIRIKREKICK